MKFYVGTYTRNEGHVPEGKGEGIYLYDLCTQTGKLNKVSGPYEAGLNPSYIAISKDKRWLYAVQETSIEESQVCGFQVELNGALKKIGSRPTHGFSGCYLSFTLDDSILLCANYGNGSVISYRVCRETGVLSEASTHQLKHSSNVDPSRQEGPHAHCVTTGGSGAMVYVADLGADRIYKFHLEPDGSLKEPVTSAKWVATPPGSGPRTIAFTSDRGFMFVSCELSNQVLVYKVTSALGGEESLELLQVISTLPADQPTNITINASDIQIGPKNHFLHVPNRFLESIASFKLDPQSGLLAAPSHVSNGGKVVRSCMVDHDGKILVVGNQNSHSLVSFWIDQSTGGLKPTGHSIECPTPAILQKI